MSGIVAAFVWSTYYLFIYYSYELDKFLVFSIPALSGSTLLIILNSNSRKSLNYLLDKSLILSSLFYFSSQFFIILSSEKNGSVITSLGVLLGNAVLTPIITIIIHINTHKIKYHVFAISMFLVIPSSTMLALYGKSIRISGILGVLFLLGVIFSLPIFFIVLNSSVNKIGSFKAISGTFFWPGLLIIGLGIFLCPRLDVLQTSISIFLLVIAGITSMGIAYILYFRSVKFVGLAMTGFLQSLVPVFTTIFVFFFEKTPITLIDLLLIFIISFGAIISMASISKTS